MLLRKSTWNIDDLFPSTPFPDVPAKRPLYKMNKGQRATQLEASEQQITMNL